MMQQGKKRLKRSKKKKYKRPQRRTDISDEGSGGKYSQIETDRLLIETVSVVNLW
tara:strand:+ start:102 stop:266 length:165 start_codon:yes stop_codon:yes gene_type:complete